MKDEEKRICDKCDNFNVSPGGCTESCAIARIANLTIGYIEDRINGEKQSCKEFKKLKPIL